MSDCALELHTDIRPHTGILNTVPKTRRMIPCPQHKCNLLSHPLPPASSAQYIECWTQNGLAWRALADRLNMWRFKRHLWFPFLPSLKAQSVHQQVLTILIHLRFSISPFLLPSGSQHHHHLLLIQVLTCFLACLLAFSPSSQLQTALKHLSDNSYLSDLGCPDLLSGAVIKCYDWKQLGRASWFEWVCSLQLMYLSTLVALFGVCLGGASLLEEVCH